MLRMIQSNNAAGAKKYFDECLSREGYYDQDKSIVGQWGGKGATKLELTGNVSREDFHQLCDNINPETGEQLTARNDTNRRVGYDMSFNAPKSFSVLHAMTKDESVKADLEKAWESSVKDTMQEMEADMQTRVRADGKNEDRTTGNMVYATFRHLDGRPVDGVPDPHFHDHVFVFNATHDETEGKWKAGQFGDIKRDAPYYEAAFHARVAKRLDAMGFSIEKTDERWEISGVPQSAMEKFSRRTQEIEKKGAELEKKKGRPLTEEEKDQLGARTRAKKDKTLDNNAQKENWNARLTQEERKAIDSIKDDYDPPPDITETQAMDYAKRHAFERDSTLSDRKLMAEALKYGVGSVSVEGVQTELNEQKQEGEIITGIWKGKQFITTRQVMREEKAMLDFAKKGRGTCKPLFVGEYQYKNDLFLDPTKDTEEQKAVIKTVLGSGDRVIGIRGGAGTGKTTVMSEITQGILEGGRWVHAFAPTGKARDMLKSEGFENANTVASLLQNEQTAKRVRNGVIWVDESGLVSTKDMKRLFDVAEQHNARVILSGDSKQHQSVGRGDAQRILEQYGGADFAEITKIRRQKNNLYKKAVSDVQDGNMKGAFDRLDQMNAIVEIDTDERYHQLAQDYVQAVEDKKSALVISPTHREGENVTALIRAKLKETTVRDGKEEKPRLGNEDREFTRTVNLNWTSAERGDAKKYQQGLVVQFHQNAKGIKRGEKLTVKEQRNDEVIVTNSEGKEVVLPRYKVNENGEREPDIRFNVYQTQSIKLAAGDKIRITQNGQTEDGKRLTNGTIREITGFTDDGDILIKTGRHGKEQAVISKDYGNLAHGYVTTSHASQGSTVDRVFIAQGSDSFAASSKEQWYVSLSRGRESAKIYTDDKLGLMEQVGKSSERVSATELTQPKEQIDEIQRRREYMAYLAKREQIKQYNIDRTPTTHLSR